MDKTKIAEALKAAGVDEAVITALTATDTEKDPKIAALQAQLDAEIGKSGGILDAKKTAQAQAEELQAKIDALESNGLGEVEKLQLENQRMQSKLDLAETTNTELKTNYDTERRSHALNKIAGGLSWMDTVPKDMQSLIVSNAMEGIDLGNEVLVADKVNGIRETYAAQLAAKVPGGAGAKPGGPVSNPNNAPLLDKMASMTDKEILSQSTALLTAAHESG